MALIAPTPKVVNCKVSRMFNPDHNASPFNAIPPIVVALVVIILGIEIVFQVAAAGFIGGGSGVAWRILAWSQFGFSDPVFEWMRTNETYPASGLWRFFTYAFLHESMVHAVFASVLLLAIGKFVGERFKSIHVLLIFFVASSVGALAYGLVLDNNRPLVGAYPGVYGLLGAFTWVLWIGAAGDRAGQIAAFRLIAFLAGLQLLFQIIGLGGYEWVADLFGFVAGFAMCFALAPGALRRWLNRSRSR